MSTVLVAGINGFVGKHLARELDAQGHAVIGTGMDEALVDELSSVTDEYYKCDLTSPEDVQRLPLAKLDAVINLAGLAQVGDSFGKDDLYMNINVGVHTTIAEELLKTNKSTRIVSVSTGAVYDGAEPMPQTEETKLAKKTSPYALSKIAMEKAMADYRERGLEVIIARPFNHIGPGQLPGFLLPDLAEQIAKTKEGGVIYTGNLETKRDYTDVRDVVRAYVLLATKKLLYPLYNICSGSSHKGTELLGVLQKVMDRKDVTAKVDKTKLRPAGTDIPEIVGSHDRLTKDTGWEPSIPFEQTIRDYVDWL